MHRLNMMLSATMVGTSDVSEWSRHGTGNKRGCRTEKCDHVAALCLDAHPVRPNCSSFAFPFLRGTIIKPSSVSPFHRRMKKASISH